MDNKPWYASQTIWGGLGAIIGGTVAAYSALKTGDIAGVVSNAQQVFVVVSSMAAAFGGLQAVIGRFKAVKPIGAAAK